MTEALLSLNEAAATAGCSVRTMSRRLSQNRIEAARKDERGQWQIPASSLAVAGPMAVPVNDDLVAQLRTELDVLRQQNSRLQAEAGAAGRQVDLLEANVDDLRMALRMLEAGPKAAQNPIPKPAPPTRPRSFLARLLR